MSVLNIFKKKKIEEKKTKEIKEKKVEKKKIEKEVVEEKKAGIKNKVVLEGASSALLLHPYLSEKSTILRDGQNKYIFEVSPRATKNEIKKLLENIYHIEVIKINVINTPAKVKRWRQKKSYFSRNKKMIVAIKEGQKIELGI
ncbi:50S ribosomal protein L23 [bacterium]|nr:MAG: 50S ribosomal protein L23 [bacterium]